MSISSFLKLVEIRTKVASVIPFVLGTLYALNRFNSFNVRNFILMFISLITIDMATTTINNYYDHKRANKTQGYNYEIHNPIVKDNLRQARVIGLILLLIALAVTSGLALFLNTNIVVLLLGAISFSVGILYSAGSIPISRTPLGECFSGIFMGFVIVFISVYIHIYDQDIVNLIYGNGILSVSVDILEIFYIFLFSIPTINSIANIMLANNICDMEDDIENKRYTLPIYVGKEKALKIFKILYYFIYFDIIILVILRIVPIISLVVFITILPVERNVRTFYYKQSKKDTFVLAVKNFMIINVVNIISLGVATIIARN
ncbi:1,4-dihydroxy-2-naphthoate polyprenyltransferase [Wukongibacter baidiensis]|uniref:1,4-dihydroxy-2-naphthoate polyprenyltransferase n=1 Tax=Wukongibacter baidiensis TaxID=1723361 RepID=UPI003D7FB489